MRHKDIEVTLSRTMNIGNYNSIKAQVGMTATLDEDDEATEAYDEVRDAVLDQLNFTLERMLEEKDAVSKV